MPIVLGLAMSKLMSSQWMPFEKKREPFGSLFGKQDYASRMACPLSDDDQTKTHSLLMKIAGISLFMLLRYRMMKRYAEKEGRMENFMRFYGRKADEMFRKIENDYLG